MFEELKDHSTYMGTDFVLITAKTVKKILWTTEEVRYLNFLE